MSSYEADSASALHFRGRTVHRGRSVASPSGQREVDNHLLYFMLEEHVPVVFFFCLTLKK